MTRLSATVLCALGWSALAHAQDAAPLHLLTTPTNEQQVFAPPGSFTTLGSPNRLWEVRSDTSFGERRALTERLELAHIVPLEWYRGKNGYDGSRFGIVLRVTFGLQDQTTSGFYSPQGPQPSVGLRFRSPSDNEWIEGGLRLLIPYPGPQNSELDMQRLALNATSTSPTADDATWLPLSSLGLQAYIATQARTRVIGSASGTSFCFGFTAGGVGSLVPMSVATSLGSVNGFVGNIHAEFFWTFVSLLGKNANFQLGVRAEASLSSFWPGNNDSVPVIVDGFMGWSPVDAVAVRLFYGLGGPVQDLASTQYGIRLQFFFPNLFER